MKPGYKQTEVGVIPEEWEMKRLSDLALLYQPITISAKQFKEAGFPVYGANGIVGFYHAANHYTWQVTVTCRGSTCGTVNRTVDECWITGNAMVLNCDQNKSLSKDFFYYLLLGQDLSDCITGTGQPQIVRSPIAAFRVALPTSLPEQRAIATALSDVDALLAALDRLLAKKRDLKQAAMQQLLTGQTRLPGFEGEWEVKRLGDLGEVTGAGVDKKVRPGEQTVRLVNYMDAYKRDFITSDDLWHEVSAGPDQARRCAVEVGDVFFTPTSEVRDDIGHSAVAVEDIPDAAYSYHLVRLRIRAPWDVRFRAYAFKTKHFTDQATMLCEGSGTRYVITLPKFRSMTVCIPSDPAEQTAIAAVLSDMDAELAALEQRRDKTRALKQGMMQELLTGRTRLLVAGAGGQSTDEI